MEGHHFATVRKSRSCAACLTVLVLASAIGALAPTIFSRPAADAIDSPDDLGLSASAAPVSFRPGDGGPFRATDDTYISSGAPDTNFGGRSKLLVDGAGCKISPTAVCKTLIKFPEFIGPASGQVPAGSTIVSADLDLVITNQGWTQDVYQVTESWSGDTATWNGFSPAGMPATEPRDQVVSPRSLGLFSINITSIVQRWVDGEPNQGLLLASDHPDGVDYESSESANPPTLTVQFLPPSSPPNGYTIVDLGTLPGDSAAVAHAINSVGQVVGESCVGASSQCHAFLWDAGTMTDLGTLGGAYGAAYDINDAGKIVGQSTNATGAYHAFLWDAGVMTDLGTLGGDGSSAFSINDAGRIVGWSDTETGSLPPHHAFLWDAGVMTDLGTLGGSSSAAFGINGAVQVVGSSDEEAFLWENGAMTGLGTLGCPVSSEALGVNGAGRVVGWSADPSCDLRHAFVWDAGTMTDLGTLAGGYYSEARAINDAGQIVGQSMNASGGYPAALWEDGTILDLGTLPGDNRAEARDINDAGQIVGLSLHDVGPKHAVLWTPASGPRSYEIRDLGTLPGDIVSTAVRLNEAGQVIGWSAPDYIGGHDTRSFLWDDGGMTDLGSLGNPVMGTMATDINEAGQVVGWSVNASNNQRAFLWEDGALTDLGVGNAMSQAMAINDAGQVAGLFGVYTGKPPYGWEVHVFLWQGGVTTDLGRVADPDPGSPRYMSVTGLNNNGQIVGWSASTELHACDTRGWLWEDGAFIDLTSTSGCMALTESRAWDINDAGQIAAWRGSTYEGPNRAYLWDDGAWTALLAPDTEGFALGINNLGQIIGFNGTSPGSGIGPFISEVDRTITALPNGFPPAFRSAANDLNDAGEAVGWVVPDGSYGGQDAALWTMAVPPSGPATLTFQKGDGGAYSETDDTYISSGRPDTNYGAGAALFVDASGCKVSPSTACKALIKFPNFLGPNLGQVKPGSVIVSALLQIEITNPGGLQVLHQLTEDWTEWGATWNGFVIPGSPGTKGNGLSFSARLGVVTVNITAIVQNWANGDANYGLLIWTNSTDGVDYRSSESTNPPKLTVTFRSP